MRNDSRNYIIALTSIILSVIAICMTILQAIDQNRYEYDYECEEVPGLYILVRSKGRMSILRTGPSYNLGQIVADWAEENSIQNYSWEIVK